MTALYPQIIYGPVRSRRLGLSLGVNLLPLEAKLCTFDCIYCECGWNGDNTGSRRFNSREEVAAALESTLVAMAADNQLPDVITFAGNGEPTMHPDFPKIVDAVLKCRDRFFPEAKVSVLSNAFLVGRPSVAEALKRVDNPILKLDASSDELVRKINKPVGHYSVREIVDALKGFEGDFILQTIFFKSPEFDAAAPEALQKWMDIVRELHPREIMVYTIDRETPDKSLEKYTVEEMTAFVQPLLDEGHKIQIRG